MTEIITEVLDSVPAHYLIKSVSTTNSLKQIPLYTSLLYLNKFIRMFLLSYSSEMKTDCQSLLVESNPYNLVTLSLNS